jgi:hypothetical protein
MKKIGRDPAFPVATPRRDGTRMTVRLSSLMRRFVRHARRKAPLYIQQPCGTETNMRTLFAIAAAFGLLFINNSALAHHGWAWTSGDNIELTGVITRVELGYPHGRLEVDVNGETWTVQVGQPWRNEEAGLKDGDLAEGVEIRVIGEPSADVEEKRLKVERLFLGEREYVLYPDRD